MGTKIQSIPRPLVRLNQWLIVLGVLCTWILQNELFLLVPLLAGICGLVFKVNPIIKIGKVFLRKHPSEYIPEDFEQQQFNQLIAVVCLSIAFVSYSLGWATVGMTFTIMVALAAIIAILGFCIGCYIRFQWQQYSYRKSLKN
ncbi:DUF4395 domain-containing protein [Bacillus dakarensis]|uniref:DUF4395 domain-containing protein n=1 Tax=Robertmurraya dakarensis TaxID=1926278 RepID=UPI000980EF41|nr:DUF4395 domain-containing protein [Bacillus dakarensis]